MNAHKRTRAAADVAGALLLVAISAGPAQAHDALQFTVQSPVVTSAAVPTASAASSAPASTTTNATVSAPANTVADRVPPPDDSNALLAAGAGALILAIIGTLAYLARRREQTGTR